MVGGKNCASCGGRYGHEVLFCPVDGQPLSGSRSIAPTDSDAYLSIELPGQIRINALVGIGSMGRVYRAFQSGVDRDVAVKILHRELTGNAELVGRFHREAKIASRLVHPNVVQVLMTGALPTGEVYLVMEYLDGISLLSALAAQGEGGALPLARTLHITSQICDAVGEAHAQTIVHRDLKPENIMLVRRGEDPDFVKVLDFGIARLDSVTENSSTQTGLIFGTAKYISPEGAEGKHVGPQADVYSIATILYQCLAGRAPFEGDSPMSVLVQQINNAPAELRSIERAAYVPESIARLIMGNLAKSPSDRSDNARVFARELLLAARDAGIHIDAMSSGIARGDLRLTSKQRTRQHEFTPELKAKIASTPIVMTPVAPPSNPDPIPLSARPITQMVDLTADPEHPASAPPPLDASDTIVGSLAAPAPAKSVTELRERGILEPPLPTLVGEPVPDSVAPNPDPISSPLRSRPFESEAPAPSDHDRADHHRRPAWLWPLLIALVAIPVTAAALYVAREKTPATEASPDFSAAAKPALAAIDRGDWEGSAGDGALAELARLEAQFPNDRRITEIRTRAAERLVSDALDKKLAGQRDEALRLVRLARAFSPELGTATILEQELVQADPQGSAAPTTRPLRPTLRGPGSASPAPSSKAEPSAEPSGETPSSGAGPWL